MTSPEKLATPETVERLIKPMLERAHKAGRPRDVAALEALRTEVEALATQRQGEGETRDAALEQAANLVECEYAADATQGRRLKQIAQHIRDLKNRKPL